MALITNTDSATLPYNDTQMVYDLERRMYLLTDVGVRQLLGEDLITLAGSKEKAEIIRYETSQDVLNFIARYSHFSSYKVKLWLIATDSTLRETFKRILADQLRYYISSGAGSLKDMHGINIANGKVIPLSNLRNDVLVSASVHSMLSISGLLHTGKLYYRDYSEDGTW